MGARGIFHLQNSICMVVLPLTPLCRPDTERMNRLVFTTARFNANSHASVDSAQMYYNEHEVGSSILAFISSPSNISSLKREDIHFTSKLASNTSYDLARKSIKQSVKQSGLGYIDLFLLHSPYGGKKKRLECWKAVEDAIEDGEVKTGGVSNFGVKHVSL